MNTGKPGVVRLIILSISKIIDQRVLAILHVNFSSGSHLYGIEIKTADLIRAVNYTLADIQNRIRQIAVVSE